MGLTTDEITAANTENLLDLSIDLLVLYSGDSISNMSGDAGSKTVTLTQAQRGAVFLVARQLYYSFYEDITPASAGPLGINPTDVLANPTMERLLRLASRRLQPKAFERT